MKKIYIIIIAIMGGLLLWLMWANNHQMRQIEALTSSRDGWKQEISALEIKSKQQKKTIMALEDELNHLYTEVIPAMEQSHVEPKEASEEMPNGQGDWLLIFESDLETVETVQDLVDFYRPGLDGAGAQSYAATIYTLYIEEGPEIFIRELSHYGTHEIRSEIVSYLASEIYIYYDNMPGYDIAAHKKDIEGLLTKEDLSDTERDLANQVLDNLKHMEAN